MIYIAPMSDDLRLTWMWMRVRGRLTPKTPAR